jgi:Flp pilus assembly protein TadG
MNSHAIEQFARCNARPLSQRGAIAVEMTFVTILMMLIVAGSIGFGRAFWYADALTKATRDGARLMSTWPAANINSGGVAEAQNLVVNMANAASISPQLTTANVTVECLDAAFSVVACVDGTAPANVRVGITGFNVTIGEWFPFIGNTGLLDYGAIGLAPHTAMRYMI